MGAQHTTWLLHIVSGVLTWCITGDLPLSIWNAPSRSLKKLNCESSSLRPQLDLLYFFGQSFYLYKLELSAKFGSLSVMHQQLTNWQALCTSFLTSLSQSAARSHSWRSDHSLNRKGSDTGLTLVRSHIICVSSCCFQSSWFWEIWPRGLSGRRLKEFLLWLFHSAWTQEMLYFGSRRQLLYILYHLGTKKVEVEV